MPSDDGHLCSGHGFSPPFLASPGAVSPVARAAPMRAVIQATACAIVGATMWSPVAICSTSMRSPPSPRRHQRSTKEAYRFATRLSPTPWSLPCGQHRPAPAASLVTVSTVLAGALREARYAETCRGAAGRVAPRPDCGLRPRRQSSRVRSRRACGGCGGHGYQQYAERGRGWQRSGRS